MSAGVRSFATVRTDHVRYKCQSNRECKRHRMHHGGVMQDLCDQCASAKKLFDSAADILGYDLLKVCAEGARAAPRRPCAAAAS